MSDEIVNDSQIENDVEEVFQDDSQEFDVREAFGLPPKPEKTEEESDEGEQSVNNETPAKEDVKPESKKRVVKFNKEDREIDESEVDELLQMGLALPKQRERTTETEKALDRAAKLAGLNSREELMANLDRMEQSQVKAQEDAFHNARQKVIDDLIYNGASEEAAIEYADNNPLVQEARKTLQERDASKAERDSQSHQQTIKSQWDEVFSAFADIEKRDIAFNGTQVVFMGETAPVWLTPEVISRLESGYKPIDAITLSNLDKIQTKTKKATEQKLIKQQQLSNRSKVADDGEQENRASEELKGAFAMFGIDPKRAQKYAK